jgi:hypothetical protein
MYKYKGVIIERMVTIHADRTYGQFLEAHQGQEVIVTVALPEEEKLMITALKEYQAKHLDWRDSLAEYKEQLKIKGGE